MSKPGCNLSGAIPEDYTALDNERTPLDVTLLSVYLLMRSHRLSVSYVPDNDFSPFGLPPTGGGQALNDVTSPTKDNRVPMESGEEGLYERGYWAERMRGNSREAGQQHSEMGSRSSPLSLCLCNDPVQARIGLKSDSHTA